MADFFQEVKDDYRREQAFKLLKKTAPLLVGIVIAVLAGTAIFIGVRHWQQKRDEAAGLAFQQLIDALDHSQVEEALRLAEAQSTQPASGYRQLAQLRLAQLQLHQGDDKKAIAIYEELYADRGNDLALRELAGLLSAWLQMEKGEADMTSRLGLLAEEEKPWRYFARELIGIAALKAGKREEAEAIFAQLAQNGEAPELLRRRAEEMTEIAKQPNAYLK